MAPETPSPLRGDIPTSSEVRLRLAATLTEASLLRALLKLALRREREAERLAHVSRQVCQVQGVARAQG